MKETILEIKFKNVDSVVQTWVYIFIVSWIFHGCLNNV